MKTKKQKRFILDRISNRVLLFIVGILVALAVIISMQDLKCKFRYGWDWIGTQYRAGLICSNENKGLITVYR